MPYLNTVSVIITTCRRSDVLPRAVKSTLQQTHPPCEIIIVIDGSDDATLQCLRQFDDHRIRIIPLQQSVGGAGARNIGVDAAKGEWIAFLDDDDEWRAEKLQAQLKMAARSHAQYPVISCRILAKTPKGRTFIWPKRRLRIGEHISDYLLARNTFTQGEGLITTSMILAPRDLLLKTRFSPGLRRHQEWDWLLRAAASAEVEVMVAWDVLATWNIEGKQISISNLNEWRTSLDWIMTVRRLVTPRAYASFLLVFVSAIAARQRDFAALKIILKAAREVGRPNRIDFMLCFAMWLVPQTTRRRLRDLFLPAVQAA